MYNLTTEQVKEFDSFLTKVPESMVRSHIQRIWDMVKVHCRMVPDQAEKIGSFITQLPNDLQTYWNSFLHLIKNDALTQATEDVNKTEKKAQANLMSDLADVHSDVKAHGKDTEDKSVAPTEDNLNISAKKELKSRTDDVNIVEEEKKKKGIVSKEDTRSEKEKGVRKGATLEGIDAVEKGKANKLKEAVATKKAAVKPKVAANKKSPAKK